MMGLFPEIGRAWLTIDSDIYVRMKILHTSVILHRLYSPFSYFIYKDLDI